MEDDDVLGSGTIVLRCRVESCARLPRDVALAWMDAARYGDAPALRRIIADVRADSGDGESKGALPFLDRLVHYTGAETSYGFVGNTALHWACANGDAPMVELLLSIGSSVDAQNLGGSTPLHAACGHGRPDMVAQLLSHGADPSIADCCGDLPRDALRLATQLSADRIRATAQLLDLHSTASRMLASPPADWSAKDMTALGRLARRAGDPPTSERPELVAQTVALLDELRRRTEQAKARDTLFLRVREATKRRKERLDALLAARAADGDDTTQLAAEAAAADRAKQSGNDAYGKGDYRTAVRWYTTAIGLDGGSEAAATYYSNRAAAYMNLQQPYKALQDAKSAVELRPGWAKAYHRLGTALVSLSRWDDAVEAFEEGLRIQPDDAALTQGLASAHKGKAAADGASERVSVPARHPNASAVSRGVDHGPAVGESGDSAAVVPPHARRPWFDCVTCENKTRDSAVTPCCGKQLCGTCLKRKCGANSCPFNCGLATPK